MTKLVIVWRSDLDVPLGKKMAQAAHAGHRWLTDRILNEPVPQFTAAELDWLRGNYRKVVLVARSEAELLLLKARAEEVGVRATLIVDQGLTVFDRPTPTCLALGPDFDGAIDEITGADGPLGRLRLA